MRKTYWLLIALVALVTAYFYATTRTDTYLGRWFAWKASDVDDRLLFPSRRVANAPPAFHFTAAPSTLGATTIQYQSDGEAKSATLDDIMAANGTHAVIVVKDDRIVYEQYFNGYRRNSIVTSFSVAKSVTSLLVGAAIDARKIKSIDDPVTAYLPELLNIDPRYAKLSLSMLLDMRSGIEFADHDLPWGDKPRAYYDPRLRDVVLSRRLAAEPGSAFQYNTYNPILLGIVLERATGMSVATWFERALWSRLGMEFGATWSIDSEIGGMEKMESGINARAIDFAKLGRLMLNRGGWNGEQVISSAWIVASMTPSEANRIPEFGQHAYYRRAWWVTAAHAGRPHAVAATGHLGQFIYIYPERNVIIVRFGAHMGGVDRWSEVFDGIVRALEVP